MMKKKSLKEKLIVAIGAAVISLLIVVFGIRLMSKVIDFAYWEREHVLAVAEFENELKKEAPQRAVLLERATYAKAQASHVNNAIFWIEKKLFHLLGQGLLLDLAEEDIQRLKEVIEFVKNLRGERVSAEDASNLSAMIKWSVEQTDVFGGGLRSAAAFVTGVVLALNILCIGSFIFIIYFIVRVEIPPLEKTAEISSSVACGNLDIDADHHHVEPSTKAMVLGLREMVNDVKQIMDELTQAAQDSSAISEQTLQGVTQQHLELKDLSDSINEMHEATGNISLASSAANAAAHNGSNASEGGGKVVNDAVTSIEALATQIENSAKVIKEIESNSENIRSVVAMINDITEQTNLLALNAAIEAARAGEHGRGFAVVADEVRTLATRTQNFTQEIYNTIDSLIVSTRNAVSVMDECQIIAASGVDNAKKASSSIVEMKQEVNSILRFNEKIVRAAEEQSAVTNSINLNTQAITTVANETASGAKSGAKSGERLVMVVDNLRKTISRFSM